MEMRHAFDVKKEGAAGVVAIMLDWAAEQDVPDGYVGDGRWSAIARRAGYTTAEEAEKLYSIMVLRGQIDSKGVIVDWVERAPEAVHGRLARAGLKFACGCSPMLRVLGKRVRENLQKQGFEVSVCETHRTRPQIDRKLTADSMRSIRVPYGTVINTTPPLPAGSPDGRPAAPASAGPPAGAPEREHRSLPERTHDGTHAHTQREASGVSGAGACPPDGSAGDLSRSPRLDGTHDARGGPVGANTTPSGPATHADGHAATGTAEAGRAPPTDAALPEGTRANMLYFDWRRDPVDLALDLVGEVDNDTTACFQRKACNDLGQERYRKLLLKLHLDARRSRRTMRNIGAILTVRTQRALAKASAQRVPDG